jgi:hypothetical protein
MVKRFPQSEGMEALLSLTDSRDHPLAEAARNSPDPEWSNSFVSKRPELSEAGPRPTHSAASQTNCRMSITSKIITSTAITKLSIPPLIHHLLPWRIA